MMRLPHMAGREVRDVIRGATPTHLHLRERFTVVIGVTIVVWLLASVAIFFLERHATDTEIHTIGSSLFWTGAQLLTVSSQMKNPISFGGRVLDLFLEMWAITVVATLAGSFGAFFHRRGIERDPIRSQGQDRALIDRPLPGQRARGS